MRSLELRIPPAVLAAVAAGAMWILAADFPAFRVALPASTALAALLATAGVLAGLVGVASFIKAETTVDPHHPAKATRLVVGGIYRFSRNPMYLGLVLVLAGWACHLANGLSALVLPAFVGAMNRLQIAPEERQLLELFGEAYESYRTRVRRWI